MSVLKLKMKVLQGVMQTESESLLSQLDNILSSAEPGSDFADELSDFQIAEIRKGLKDAEEGKVVDWDVAMDRLNGK